MIIPIPTSYVYSCEATGSTFKIVRCEHCRFVYVYRMERTTAVAVSESILGDGSAGMHAHQLAEGALNRKLQDDCDAVPCLECGKYQDHMVAALRRDFQPWRWYAGVICIGSAVVAGIFGLITLLISHINDGFPGWFATAAGVFAVIGFPVLLIRRRQLNSYDPNATDLSERMKLAARYAKTVDEFREYLRQHGIDWNLRADLEAK